MAKTQSESPAPAVTVAIQCPRKTGDDASSIARIKNEAHVRAKFPEQWKRDGKSTGANPERSNALLARESWEFVRFINPGDLRVAAKTCGGGACHDLESKNVARSMMSHGAMLWGARSTTTAVFLSRTRAFAESYTETGAHAASAAKPKPTAEAKRTKGLLEFLDPIPRWEISQPAMCCVYLSAAASGVWKWACRTKKKIPANPTKD